MTGISFTARQAGPTLNAGQLDDHPLHDDYDDLYCRFVLLKSILYLDSTPFNFNIIRNKLFGSF